MCLRACGYRVSVVRGGCPCVCAYARSERFEGNKHRHFLGNRMVLVLITPCYDTMMDGRMAVGDSLILDPIGRGRKLSDSPVVFAG